MTLSNRAIGSAVTIAQDNRKLAHENKQLSDQVERLKATVAGLDTAIKELTAELMRNRETIKVQALRIAELEQQSSLREHHTVDTRPAYVVADGPALHTWDGDPETVDAVGEELR